MTSDSRRGKAAAPTLAAASERGFTLIELIVVLAVLGVLLGAALPLAGAVVDADRRKDVVAELDAIATALENHWFDRASFPTALNDSTFLGVYLHAGTNNTAVLDGWGQDLQYVYSVDSSAGTATVYSRGSNAADDGVANEEFKVTVYAAVPGLQKTRQRMRVIVEALANFLEAGGTLTGTWATDRAAMGLGSEYATDGFGTAFTLTSSTLTLRSAGPDRVMNNADDVTS